jgi:hypothetical protein
MQACHRAIALRSASLGGAGLKPLAEISKAAIFPDCEVAAGWSIYLDDTTVLEKVQMVVAEDLAGSPAEEQKQLRQAYAWWGIPTDAAKSLERVRQTERLGADKEKPRPLWVGLLDSWMSPSPTESPAGLRG